MVVNLTKKLCKLYLIDGIVLIIDRELSFYWDSTLVLLR